MNDGYGISCCCANFMNVSWVLAFLILPAGHSWPNWIDHQRWGPFHRQVRPQEEKHWGDFYSTFPSVSNTVRDSATGWWDGWKSVWFSTWALYSPKEWSHTPGPSNERRWLWDFDSHWQLTFPFVNLTVYYTLPIWGFVQSNILFNLM